MYMGVETVPLFGLGFTFIFIQNHIELLFRYVYIFEVYIYGERELRRQLAFNDGYR